MNAYKEFYVDYNRNSHKDGEQYTADMLLSAADDAGGLYVDFYAIPDEIAYLPPNHFVRSEIPAKSPGFFGKLLNYKTISAYVCVQVENSQQLRDIWKQYVYSSPKIYRIGKLIQPAQNAAFESTLIEKFEWAPLQELSSLLETNICLFRDFHDEIGLEVLCLESFEERVKHLISLYLGVE